MSDAPLVRVVIDTNVLLRAPGQLVQACEARRAIALLSRPLVGEYRRVLYRAAEAHSAIDPAAIEVVLRRLKYFGQFVPRVHARFAYPRDPTDSKLIELAIETGATHIASYDADLLTLPSSRHEAGKRFRQRLRDVRVCFPDEILTAYPALMGNRS